MYENRHLRAALRARAEAGKHIALHWKHRAASVERGEFGVTVSLDDGRVLRAPLLVAAEGRNSPTREAAGIRVARWKYDHAAIVSTLRHELPHDQVAHEIFYPAGPFALLPMNDDEGGHRSAIVWSVSAADAPGLLSLSDADFAAEAEAAMGGFLGKIDDDRAALLLSARLPPCRADHRATASRWSATRRTASIRSPGRASTSAIAMPPRWRRCWSKARGSGSTLATAQLLDRYQALARGRHLHGRARHRHADADLRRQGQDREPRAALRHGADRPHRPGQGPPDGRSARHERGLAAAAARVADLDSPDRLRDGDYCSVWPMSAPPGRQALELHQLDDQFGAAGEAGFLEQRLLGAGVERRDLGDGVDQHFVVEPPDRVPVDRQPERIAEAARLALDRAAQDQRQRVGLAVVERGEVDVGLAIERAAVGLGDQAEAVRALEDDVEAPVVELLDPDDLAEAAGAEQRRWSLSLPSLAATGIGWIIAIRPGPASASRTISR